MNEELTYKHWLRRTELASIHPDFLEDAKVCRTAVGIPEGGFFCTQRAMWWDTCQKLEPVPKDWTRPKDWVPEDFFPDQPWGMPKRLRQKRAQQPGLQSRVDLRETWPRPPGTHAPPPRGEDLLSLVVRALIANWRLLQTADTGMRYYLLTNDDHHLEFAALAYPIEVEVVPVEGATVTIRGLHPHVTQRELKRIWDDVRWRLKPYAQLLPDTFGKGRYRLKGRPNKQRDFFIYRKVQFEGMTVPDAMDEWLEIHPQKVYTNDGDEGAVRKAFDRLRREIEAMRPLE